MGICWLVLPSVNMKHFAVLSALVSCAVAAPVAEAEADPQLLLAKPYINSGSASGPLTPLVGDLVATNRGYASLSLEGFSEDVNEDGFVDPIAHAAPVAPVAYHVATAPVVHQVGYQVHHQVHHVPQVTVQKHTSTHTTHHVINHAPVIGAFTGLVPVAAAAPAEAAAEAAPVVEEA